MVTLQSNTADDDPTLPLLTRLNSLPSFDSLSALNISSLDDAESLEHLPGNYTCKYYSIEDVHVPNSLYHKFGIIHFNCRSMKNKFDDFLALLEHVKFKFTVICLCETWFSSEIEANMYSVDGFRMYSSCRLNQKGGGVSILVDHTYASKVTASPNFDHIESCSVEVALPSQKIQVNCIYNPRRKFNEEQSASIESYLIENLHKLNIFCGDWNLNLLNYSTDEHVARYVNAFSSYGYRHVIDRCTRIHSTLPLKASLIDHISLNSNNYFVDSGVLLSSFSDHFPVFAIFNNLSTVFQLNPNRKIRDFSRFNDSTFLNFLACQNWDFYNNSPDKTLLAIQSNITSVLDLLAPFKIVSRKQSKRKPWISNDIIRRTITKRKLYLRYLNTGRLIDKLAYREYSNSLGKLVFRKKKDYYANRISEASGNMKRVWTVIKDMLAKKQSNPGPKAIKTANGGETSIDFEIANAINDFFVNVGPGLASQFNPSATDFKAHLKIPPCPSSCVFMPTDSVEVYSVIHSFDNKTSAGCDGISANILKLASPIISQPLANLINHCFTTGTYPDQLKVARVVPIFKKGSPTDPGNYRPISVLPLLNKVFEKVIHTRLRSFLDSKNILNNKQFGFRKGHSTSDALMELSDDLQTLSDKGLFSCSIYVDLKKAFDTVNHDILLAKLYHYGIRGNFHKLLRSYFSNRKQFTVVNGVSSQCLEIKCGVPQGSVLGPLFFNIYVNDLSNATSHAKTILFADDTNFRYSANSYEGLEQIIRDDLPHLFKWFSDNKLTVSLQKTSYMIIAPPRAARCDSFSIVHNNTELVRVPSVKYLGVYVDENLKWSDHITYITNKINKNVAVIWKTRRFLSFQHRKMLYNSLIASHLQYCCGVWGAGPPSRLNGLLSTQNRCLKIMSFTPRLESPKPLYSKYKVLDIYKLVYQAICIFMYRVKSNQAPPSLTSKFSSIIEGHSCPTRLAQYGFITKRYRNNRGKYCISTLGPKLFNKLPHNTALSATGKALKSSLYSHLLQLDQDIVIDYFR